MWIDSLAISTQQNILSRRGHTRACKCVWRATCTLEVVRRRRRQRKAARIEGGQALRDDSSSPGVGVLLDRPLSSIAWMCAGCAVR